MQTFWNAEGFVYHMEIDVIKKNRIVYSDENSLKTVDFNTTNYSALGHSILIGLANANGYSDAVGTKARFKRITGFFQLPEWGVIYIVDNGNHCIRKFIPNYGKAFEWVGKCGENGNIDGSPDVSRLDLPHSIAKDPTNGGFLFVTERGNNCIRRMDLQTGGLITVIRDYHNLFPPTCIASDAGYSYLITCHEFNLAKIDISTYNNTILGGTSYGDMDGELSTSQFSHPSDVLFLSSTIMLVADMENNKLRVINEDLNSVSSVCLGLSSHNDGLTADCNVVRPKSLLKEEKAEVIFVGHFQGIRYLRCEYPIPYLLYYA